VRNLVLVLPLLSGPLHETLKVAQKVVPVEALVKQGTELALVRELPRGKDVLRSMDHPEHLARCEVLQQCHFRSVV